MDIYTLRDFIWDNRVHFTWHARREMQSAYLSEVEVRESILSGALIDTEIDQTGTKYRVQGESFITNRIIETICAVSRDETTNQAQLIIVTVYERKPKRRRRRRR